MRLTISAAIPMLALLIALSGAHADTFVRHGATFRVGPSPSSVVARDLNGDGSVELVVACRGTMSDPREERPANDEVWVIKTSTNLTCTPLPPLRTGFAPYAIAVANMDEFRELDIIVASFLAVRDRDVSVFRNLDKDIFEGHHFNIDDESVKYTKVRDGDGRPVFTTPGLTALVVADANQDGYRDVIATGWCSDVIAFFPGARDTLLGEPKLTNAPGGPRSLDLIDLDGDDIPDLVTVMYNTSQVYLWKGDGDGGFEPVDHFPSRGRLPHRVRVADLNGDGLDDIVVSHSYSDDSVVVFYGAKDDPFAVSQEIRLGSKRDVVEREIRDLVVHDLNGDGRCDIAVACYESADVRVLINRSSDTSVPQRFRTERYQFEDGRPRALAVADVNRNGGLDLVVALWEPSSVGFLLGEARGKE